MSNPDTTNARSKERAIIDAAYAHVAALKAFNMDPVSAKCHQDWRDTQALLFKMVYDLMDMKG